MSSRACIWKELNNESRNWLEFHVFLSFFIHDFKRLPNKEQVKLFSLPGNPSQEPDELNNENNKDSCDGTDAIKGDNNNKTKMC